MALSVYVHIPYCLQRCRYCDFTTFEQSEILPPDEYVQWVLAEIRNRHHLWDTREIQTLYFGGGTPSLIDPQLIVTICRELANVGFSFKSDAERTIEINPATINEAKLSTYLEAGINRFSVGAQTFNSQLLQACGRRHTANDTRETLQLLRQYNLNYSFDLLFALPAQTIDDLKKDLAEVEFFNPPHLSAYCLTVPEGHPMNIGRPPENDQVEMFALIESHLLKMGLLKYEISNFARPGFESRHNQTYWSDQSYWGIGVSSHSYQKEGSPWGRRFWNPKSLKTYATQVALTGQGFAEIIGEDQIEQLKDFEALTDFSHIFLRTTEGMPEDAVHNKFPKALSSPLLERLQGLVNSGLIERSGKFWRLTTEGQMISNKVFEELTFLASDLQRSPALTASLSDTYCSV